MTAAALFLRESEISGKGREIGLRIAGFFGRMICTKTGNGRGR